MDVFENLKRFYFSIMDYWWKEEGGKEGIHRMNEEN